MTLLDTPIVAFVRFAVYRDGGSVSATFTGADGIEYSLFFQVGQPEPPGEPRRYAAAVLKWSATFDYRSPVTGDISPGSRADSAPVTWAEARRILHELAPLVPSDPHDQTLFAEMTRAAAS